jgi:acetoin utilization deacetylase AcuC-like enzyme
MGAGHPERPQRLEAILSRIEKSSIPGLEWQEPVPAPMAAVLANHSEGLIGLIQRLSATDGLQALTPDTAVCPATWDAALLASGGALAAVDAVLAGHARNAMCLHRPPGHHAERDTAMGFCFFNHVAIAARHLRDRGVERVAIIDWDVHHGNGTQNAFYDDGNVFFCSMHQSPHYPGTGNAAETGYGAGIGATLNIPLPAGQGDNDYEAIMAEHVRPALQQFQPAFLLVSAGFDAHHQDPLGDMELTAAGFARLTEQVAAMAREFCGGRLVSVLEGGYDLQATASSVQVHLEVLAAS